MSTANEKLVTELCTSALLSHDINRVLSCLSEDAYFYNGPFETVTGHKAIHNVIAPILAHRALEKVEIKNTASSGELVMNERVETWAKGDVRIQLPIVGIFTVKGDKIVRWCDYFDGGTAMPFLEALKG
ncbi:MAG: limonene-1,2-epoxide hydrolase family protein [Candidatus Binatia bacterium]